MSVRSHAISVSVPTHAGISRISFAPGSDHSISAMPGPWTSWRSAARNGMGANRHCARRNRARARCRSDRARAGTPLGTGKTLDRRYDRQRRVVRVYDSDGNWLGIGEIAVEDDARNCVHARSFRHSPGDRGHPLMPVQVSFQAMEPATRVVTIGTFDGVHLGHAKLISSTRERADRTRRSFHDYHLRAGTGDRCFGLTNSLGRICTAGRKLTLLEALGTDEIVGPGVRSSPRRPHAGGLSPRTEGAHRPDRAVGWRRVRTRSRPRGGCERISEIGDNAWISNGGHAARRRRRQRD